MSSNSSDAAILKLPWFKTARIILIRHRFLMLVGEMATGKTTFAQFAAREITHRDPEILPCSPETERTDVWGSYQLVGDGTHFADGPLPRALKLGSWLVAEEFGLAPLETRATLLTLRGQKQVVNPLCGESIPIPDSFRLVATSNPENMSCRRNVGIARALYDDFQVLEVPVLSTALVKKMLGHNFPESAAPRIERVMSLWNEYRQLTGKSDGESGESYLTYRAAAHLLGLLEDGLDEETAVRVALVGKFITDKDLHSAARLKADIE